MSRFDRALVRVHNFLAEDGILLAAALIVVGVVAFAFVGQPR